MALTAGTLATVSVTAVSVVLSQSVAVSGTTPYSYGYYRSTVSGFTPSTANLVQSAAVAPGGLSLTDTGLTPGTQYYYKSVIVDTNGTPVTVTGAQLAVQTLSISPDPNQFGETTVPGMLDQAYNYNTKPVMFDPNGSGSIVASMALKWVTGASGMPLVAPSLAQADVIAGFANFNFKNAGFDPGDILEMSENGNVMWLIATAAINRGSKVVSLPAAVAGGCNGGVAPTTGSSGFPIVGVALDQAASGEQLRVMLQCPSNQLDS